MKDKKKLLYEEARIVKTDPKKWYIHYKQTNPNTRKLERKRPTFKINTIKNIKEREEEAEKWVRYINSRLPKGYPFEQKGDPKKAYEKLKGSIRSFLESVPVLAHRNHFLAILMDNQL